MTMRRCATIIQCAYLAETQDLQVRLRGEVHRLVAPRDQKYQSNFVEVPVNVSRLSPLLRLNILDQSFGTIRSSIGDMQDCSSAFVSTPMTTS